VRILIADDHEVMRHGVRALVESQSGWEVCGEAVDGRQAVDLAAELRPEVVILDVSMPGLNGLEAASRIRKVSPSTAILIFSVHDSDRLVAEARSTGARGYVLKSAPAAQILAAVAAAARHEPTVDHARPAPAGSPLAPVGQGAHGLTPRQREIARLLADGKSNWCIATILGIRISTVETHRRNIMQKLKLESIVELVHYAVRNQLIAP
jgi:DNA-binding NarL/FixJ family response regulator